MQCVEINLGSIIGKRCLAVEDEAFANTLTHLYGGALSNLVPAEKASTASYVLTGTSEAGYSLDGGDIVEPAFALGLLDYQFDQDIRAYKNTKLCVVHSCGLVAYSGGAIAVLGESGSGKTTLGLACALSGFGYMGDEFGFLDLESGAYSHAKYPLCVRIATWDVLDVKRPAASATLVSPLGNKADVAAIEDVLGCQVVSPDACPLAVVIVPRRRAGAAPRLRTLTVAEWPVYVMPSLDARLPRDELFRRLVSIVSRKGIKVLAAEYEHIEDGVELVKMACKQARC